MPSYDNYDILIYNLELQFRRNHPESSIAFWAPVLKLAPANFLLTVALATIVFVTAWTTRGIHHTKDLSPCAVISIGISVAAILYFAGANSTLVGVGIHNRGEQDCDAIARPLVLVYMLLKGYVGVFLARKLFELCEDTYILTSGMQRAKRSYQFLFGPLVLGYLCIVVLVCIFLSTSLWYTGHSDLDGNFVPTDSHCILHLKNSTAILLALIGYVSFGAPVLALAFSGRLGVLKLIAFQNRSVRGSIGCILAALGPVVTSAYLLLRGGHEAATVILAFNSADVMASFLVVWFVEGSWKEGRYNSCLCGMPMVDVPKIIVQEMKTKPGTRMQGRIVRLARAKRLQERLIMDNDPVLEREMGNGIKQERREVSKN